MTEKEANDLIVSAFSSEAMAEAVSRVVASGYEKCSLCNNIIEGEAEHVLREHPHVQHIHAMVAKPIPPLPARGSQDQASMDVGAFAVATSLKADRGEDAFRVVQRARAQLHRLLDGVQGIEGHVYLFGSVVSMGSWDGVGDGDFSFICPKWYDLPAQDGQVVVRGEAMGEDSDDETTADRKEAKEVEESSSVGEADDLGTVSATALRHASPGKSVEDAATEKPQSSALSLAKEKRIIRNIAARLRDAGFRFEELEPVLNTRIPVVRRKRAEQEPPRLHSAPQRSLICVRFDTAHAEEEFRKGRLSRVISTYNAEEVPNRSHQRGRSLVLSVPDSSDAIHLMSQWKRQNGVRREWLGNRRSPEIFSIDFDLSCRCNGIRNSWLLRRYLAQSEVFRVGNVFLKTWSKACGVNNSRVGFLTSYAVSVLWIYFLLRRGEVAFVNPEDIPALPNPEEQMEVPYIPLWSAVADAKADAARTARLGNLLRGFFYFYGEEFDWDTHVATIRQPFDSAADIRTKEDLGWEKSDTLSLVLRNRCYHIFSIEDVYEDDLDLGRHLTPEKAAWIRLQFRLAYRLCCLTRRAGRAASPSPLWQLLDTPRKRAEDVLHARLYAYLLHNTEDAAAPISEILEQLGVNEESAEVDADAKEDPLYLACAYELGNRLCDLWFDDAQVAQDTAFHKMYNRRSMDYTPPANPTTCGEWAAVCTDDLQEHHDPTSVHQQRSVRLVPPLRGEAGTPAPHFQAANAPARERVLQLIKSRRQYEECARELGAHAAKKSNQAPAAVVGVQLKKSAAGTLYPHCFYPLQQHRLFETYEARATFTRCVRDVIGELALLRDADAPAAFAEGGDVLHDRNTLLRYLKKRLCSSVVVADRTYEAVLQFLCLPTEPYIHALQLPHGHNERPMLHPTPLFLSLVGGGSSGPGVAAKAKVPRAHPPYKQ
ncbi:conserved hypothetical protein [Leishmania mexicana MHOM/GT/2001/U1103]|uniref:RNA uridylyltransferase n=1 Tax=Leishmania mexicana (strain MHOM/GT/2001/U1103) TaxID=929439 RepID=E9AS95_LEIMU|nr:conserved hypothetical protein [Leishmania mexicana MHOM/GT/2001/U1103]CBZ25816.1 conserved hypothetical protein [Leishmania mexicana MHOM/GT/2001/U1103]